MFSKRFLILIILIFSIFILTGCAANLYNHYQTLNQLTASGQYQQADTKVQENFKTVYGDKDLLLYYFDRGLLLHLDGRWQESNQMFTKAEKLADDYFTKSISAEASTFLVSDNMRPYYGEDFERAMIHVFSALNYIYLNQWDEALVEARRVDLFLNKLKTDYSYKNNYTEDAFIRYLMGLIYESQREKNDAFISYRKALQTYKATSAIYKVKVPEELVFSALQMAQDLRFNEEYEEIQKDFPQISQKFVPLERKSNTGEIILLHYNGLVPHKIDNIFEMAFGKAWVYVGQVQVEGEAAESVQNASTVIRSIASDEQIIIALPKFVPTKYDILYSQVQINNMIYSSELVEDIGQIAIKNLDDRMGRVFAKAVARAAVKFALTRAAQKKIEKQATNPVGAWILTKTVKTVSALTEKADKRSWQTLPDQIRMVRIRLSEGNYSFKLSFIDSKGYVAGNKEFTDVKVSRGKKTFLYVRTVQ